MEIKATQGNKLEDGAVVSHLVDGKLVEDKSQLAWHDQGAVCRGCGKRVEGTTFLEKELILLNGEKGAEEFIASERGKMQKLIAEAGDLCSDCVDQSIRSQMSFGGAIDALKRGLRVTRKGWTRAGMWLELQIPDAHSKMGQPYIFITPTSSCRVPWVASQPDMLADDWSVIDG